MTGSKYNPGNDGVPVARVLYELKWTMQN